MCYSKRMTCPRVLWLFSCLAIIWTKQATAQDSFGEILLQAFTTGMAPSVNPGPTPAPVTPVLNPDEVLPEETLVPVPTTGFEDDSLPETAESTAEFEIESSESVSPAPSSEVSIENEETMIMSSSYPFPEFSSEDLPIESFEPFFEESPSPTAYVPVNDESFLFPIRVNCGSFNERSAFREDADKWFNVDSLTAEDPYALARFSSISEAVLYATYRYAEEVLTYSVPIFASGMFELRLHWAEISPLFMKDGARVLEVIVNGKVLEPSLDVYRESMYGSYSPLVRSYLVDVPKSVITIQILRQTGQPMLSAFQILRAGMSERPFGF